MLDDFPGLLARIRHLVDGLVDDPPERLLERMEHTLTDGYAHALALEGQSMRIERQIGATLSSAKNWADADELGPLVERRSATEHELRGLRELLDALKQRVDLARSEAAATAR